MVNVTVCLLMPTNSEGSMAFAKPIDPKTCNKKRKGVSSFRFLPWRLGLGWNTSGDVQQQGFAVAWCFKGYYCARNVSKRYF